MQKLPFCSAKKFHEIAAVHPTPFHLYDEKGIRETARRVQAAFSWNAGFREHFAVKANPNPYILSVLKSEGCGVDCASITELMLAKAVGFAGDDIMFSSNMTPAEDYVYARKLGAIINLDDITHIEFLKQNGGIPEKICLRYNPGGELHIGNTCMGHPWDAKYGMTRPQIFQAIRMLQNEGVRQFGLHTLLASNSTDAGYYPTIARMLFKLAVEAHETMGADFFMVNLSGGVGIPYRPQQSPADIEEIADDVRRLYERMIAPTGMNVHIASELGRYMTGPHGCLVATAIHEKHIYKEYIGLDACAVDLMRPAMYGAYHHITIAGKENQPCDHIYDIVGSLCENNDKFAIDRPLPHIDIGDLVVIHDTGAHGYSMGYNYNGKLRSAEVLLHEDGTFEQIRRAETPLDYFATIDRTPYWSDIKKETEALNLWTEVSDSATKV